MLTLQPSGTRPLYEQISETLQREIADGTLPAGTRLPSSRQLARDLRVSRITVVTAYAELEAAGAIEARAGSGTYVLPPWMPPQTGGRIGETAAFPSASALPPWQRDLVHPVNAEREATLAHVLRGPLTPDTIGFAWGAGDPRLIPMTEFRRALADVLDRDGPSALGPEGGAGYPPLRHWLADYLRQNGLVATPDDILVTGGTQQTISLVAATLL
jgi:GntR family transcriptional regulator / MocR family aminotransferase